MKHFGKLLFAGILLAACAITNAQAPATAAELMAKAQAKATAEKKAIFVVFDASW